MVGLDRPACKLVFSGKIGSAQTWSVGPWVRAPFNDVAMTQGALNAFAVDAGGAWAPQSGSWFSPFNVATTTITSCTVYFYNTGSIHADKVSAPAPLTTVGSGTATLPSLLAIVASLHSGVPGKSGRGRIYIPLTRNSSLDTDGQVGDTVLQTACNGLKSAMNNLASGAGYDFPPVPIVASFTTGDTQEILSVSMNSLVDVQHRREDSVGINANKTATL
jgi:hypothetical protein